MTELIIAGLLIVGAAFMLVAALGALRMPDLLTRMHATTKAGVFGAGLTMLAVALHFGTGPVIAKAIAIVAFLILTAPVAAHAIGRAGYFVGVPLWENTQVDELKERYDPETHTLASPPSPSGDAHGDAGDAHGDAGDAHGDAEKGKVKG